MDSRAPATTHGPREERNDDAGACPTGYQAARDERPDAHADSQGTGRFADDHGQVRDPRLFARSADRGTASRSLVAGEYARKADERLEADRRMPREQRVFLQVGVHSMGTIFRQHRRLVSSGNCAVGTRRPFFLGYLVMRACSLR